MRIEINPMDYKYSAALVSAKCLINALHTPTATNRSFAYFRKTLAGIVEIVIKDAAKSPESTTWYFQQELKKIHDAEDVLKKTWDKRYSDTVVDDHFWWEHNNYAEASHVHSFMQFLKQYLDENTLFDSDIRKIKKQIEFMQYIGAHITSPSGCEYTDLHTYMEFICGENSDLDANTRQFLRELYNEFIEKVTGETE